jgi:hypothetical protein
MSRKVLVVEDHCDLRELLHGFSGFFIVKEYSRQRRRVRREFFLLPLFRVLRASAVSYTEA